MGWLQAAWDWLTDTGTTADTPAQPVREATFTGTSYDPDATLTAAQGGSAYYRKLTQTPRDLNPLTDERARDIAYWLYDTNPLAKRVVELIRDWVIGDGVTVSVATVGDEPNEREQAIQAVIDRFWTDPRNRLDLTIDDKILELGLAGEQCYSLAVTPANGHVRLGYIDPGRISRILTDPLDATQPVAVVVKGATSAEEERFKIVRIDEDVDAKTFGRLVGARVDASGAVIETYQPSEGAEPKRYLGSCLYFTINKPISATRGRGDLLSLADWIDAFDNMLMGEVDRSLLMKSFVWDITLTGADETVINKRRQELGAAPKPGSVNIHNDRELWAAVNPDLKSFDAQISLDMVLSTVATGAGLPKTWLNGMLDVNRASATEMSEPTIKRLTQRQRYVQHIVETLVTVALDQAELAGRLPERSAADGLLPDAWPLVVTLPEIRTKDLKQIGDTLTATASGLVTALTEHLIDRQTAQDVFALVARQTGVDIDLATMRERIEEEQAEDERQQRELFAQAGGGPDGNSNGNGRANGDLGRLAALAKGSTR